MANEQSGAANTANNSAGPQSSAQKSLAQRSRWRVVDIVVAAVLGVAVGVVFWAWSALYGPVSIAFAAFPPLGGLYGGGWLIAGVIGGLVIRKPGAALFCELIAAAVEGVLGTHFGMTVLLSGLVQGLGAEFGFALFRYRRFNLPPALLAGALAGAAMGLNDNLISNVAWEFSWKVLYFGFAVVSGMVIAGLVSWLITRGLARTGALANLASRRAAGEPAF
ncbi:ECF transporter S component [Arthrobacter russicus]|uniref:Energy-coupling factor transport system substrate-specific component n=1 Tax=Arthrobacter russicus TaxID=172040 RepID=A0ABU1JCE6_9MICC|nr:ECF transporter S component [Arthrobacter russicus]MDR6270028.1 energy-coupling factor transport system substrate-specific component [Arthrobacter russicus]